MCVRWRDSFQAFLDDMGPQAIAQALVGAAYNVNGNYEPSNVRWAQACGTSAATSGAFDGYSATGGRDEPRH